MEAVLADIDKSDKAIATKNTLKSRIKSLYTVPLFPKDALSAIDKVNRSKNDSTKLSLLNTVLSVSKVSPSFKKALGPKQSMDILVEADELKDKESKRRSENAERETDVSWSYLKSLAPQFKKMDDESQLLFHLFIEPGSGFVPRVDFANMMIVDDIDETEDEEHNYYVRDTNQFIMHEYKTAKKYGTVVVDAPEALAKFIPDDQVWMFPGLDDDPLTANALSKKIARSFKRASGKPITLITIRRAFAAHIKDLPEKERRRLAIQMGHSLSTNKQYESKK